MNCRPFRIRDAWFYVVNRKLYGPFSLKAYAQAAYETELQRAIKRKRQQLEEDKSKNGRTDMFDEDFDE